MDVLQKRHGGFPILSNISFIMRVVEQVDSVKFRIISEIEARHSITEYRAAAVSRVIGADEWNLIVVGMSMFCLIICVAKVPHFALLELRSIRLRIDCILAMSDFGKLSMTSPLNVSNIGKPHPLGGREARRSAQDP